MQQSRYGVGNRSGSASQSQPALKPAKGWWGKLIRFFQTGFLNPRFLYRKSRTFLWMGTTGLIFLIAPFAFSHFLEVSEELSQISKMGAQESNAIQYIHSEQNMKFIIEYTTNINLFYLMSDNSSIISGVESDQEKKQISQKYLSQNKSEKIKALVEEKQNWGKNKEKYYKGDAESGDSEAEIEEEMEARALQTKAAQKMQDDDFWDVQINQQDEEQIVEQKASQTYSEPALVALSIELGVEPEVLEKMDIKDLNAAILRGWPEIKGILKEVDNVSKEIKGLKKLIQKEKEAEIKRYYKIRVQLLESYLALLFFYFQLRAKTRLSQHHPIFKKINELKDQIEDSENYEKYAQLIHMHNSHKSVQVNEVQKKEIEETRENTLTLKRKLKTIYNNKEDLNEKKINKIKRLLEEVDERHLTKTKKIEVNADDDSKISVDQEDMLNAMNNNDENIEEGIDDIYQQNLDRIQEKKKEKKNQKRQEKLENFTKLNKLQKLHEVGEDDPRKITYVMLKNISLMRRRRGNRIKNSRIKHKERYQKALYKLKSQSKYLKTPQAGTYTGEAGIKSGLVKGVRLQ